MPMPRRIEEVEEVARRDAETLEHIAGAAVAVRAALQGMPNDVLSTFDPMATVPELESALRTLDGILADHSEEAR